MQFLQGKLITTEYEIRVKDPVNRPRKPVTIALIADLHDHNIGPRNEDLLRKIRCHEPDLILSAGDLVTAKAGFGRMRNALAFLEKLCSEYPVCVSDGNHESRYRMLREDYPGMYRRYVKSLMDMGAVYLNNKRRIVRIHGMRIAVSGFVQPLSYYNRFHPGKVSVPEMEKALGTRSEEKDHLFELLIAHTPDHFDAYADWGADLTVSGHIHGGIIRLPLIGGVLGGTLIPFPKYDKGLFEKKGNNGKTCSMIVSAGLGAHSIAFRVNNPPELVIIRLI